MVHQADRRSYGPVWSLRILLRRTDGTDWQCLWFDWALAYPTQPAREWTSCPEGRFTIDEIQEGDSTPQPYVSFQRLPLIKGSDTNLISPALERAKLLDKADFFETAHTAAAKSGQSAPPVDLDNVDTHFITFIEAVNIQG